jgi:DNA repair ATPase RecN
VVSAYWVRIRPQEDQLRQTQEDLQTAQMTIEELEAQLVEMNRLKAENARLQEDLDLSQIRYEVLSALVDVSTAQIALGAGDVARAKASLDDTQARLERLEKSLDAPHSFSIESMLDRLGLAMDEIDENTFAAMKDLEVLASDLQTLRQKLGGR